MMNKSTWQEYSIFNLGVPARKTGGIPRHGYDLVNSEGSVIGNVTSGTMSPVLNKGIGMGYVAREYSAFGTQVFVKIRNKAIAAEIVKIPFI